MDSKVLIISADFSEEDAPVLLVGELENGKTTIVNNFEGKQAIEIYDQLNKKNDKAVSPLMTSLSLSVEKINRYGDPMTWECLYDCISDYETANALAQLAMSEKEIMN